MARIKVEVAGDRWINRDDVIANIQRCHQATHLIFELNTEGPSLHELGIIDEITQQITAVDIPSDRIWIDCWHNPVEKIPFKRAFYPALSHFFWMSENYRHTQFEMSHIAKPLAFFVGRLTVERAVMLRDICQDWQDDFVLSLMKQHGESDVFSDRLEPWIDPSGADKFLSWCRSVNIGSLTNHWVRDQYIAGQNTNGAMIAHYGKFHIELTSETYCRGETFFPTEKTIRPLSQRKPLLLFGPAKFLARLRDLGFRTWDDIWDESYDDLEGPARWQAMKTSIKAILNNRHYHDARIVNIANHNVDTLEKLIKKHSPG